MTILAAMSMHPDQLAVPAETVRALVDAQFPEWAALPVTEVAGAGTVNAIFRIGSEFTARFPLQPGDPKVVRAGLAREAAATAELSEAIPFRTPRPVALGDPGAGYPLSWSVQTWVPGTTADATGSDDLARDLAVLIRAMRAVDTRGRAFDGIGRGGDLRGQDDWIAHCLTESAGLLDVPALRDVWADLRTTPRREPDAMSHRDLIPGNVLVDGGRLTGVIDGGLFGPADPALDLVAGWHLLDAGPRAVFRDALGSDATEWRRGTGWAFAQAMGLPWYYRESNPRMAALGISTLDRILAART